ncbi:GDP-L-fucose synthase [Pontibacter sp. JAM-7]|uniref:GDP-L-fucose synthase n=1 Tax=Pontibacter sp. JAM-7 TaxID=3366581 RepID=UPI003AF853F2
MKQESTAVYVAGHNGMVGSAIVRHLHGLGCHNIITADHSELDLTNQSQVADFFAANNISQVYLAAAKVGGIIANNSYPADFIYNNLMIQANVIHAAHVQGVQKLLFLGSSCIYPRLASQPMSEAVLLTGELEPTNEPYAIAKIAGIKLCESYNRQFGRDYRSVMPTNLYGTHDNFHPDNSHVIPAMMSRFHFAKLAREPSVAVWGSGKPRREFLHVDEMASACAHVMALSNEVYSSHTEPMQSHINIGSGLDYSILELAHLMAEVVEYPGEIVFDTSKPDGTPRKLLDVSRLNALGWSAQKSLQQGLLETYEWFVTNLNSIRQ